MQPVILGNDQVLKEISGMKLDLVRRLAAAPATLEELLVFKGEALTLELLERKFRALTAGGSKIPPR